MVSFKSLVSLAFAAGTAVAAPIAQPDNSSTQGRAGSMTYYDPNTGKEGACGQLYVPGDTVVALSASIYGKFGNPNNNGFCDQWIWISFNGQKTRARVFDMCPADECDPGHIDVSPNVFQAVSDLTPGHIQVEWGFESAGSSTESNTPTTPVNNTPVVSNPPVVNAVENKPVENKAVEEKPKVEVPAPTTVPAAVPSSTTYDDGFYTPKVYADGTY